MHAHQLIIVLYENDLILDQLFLSLSLMPSLLVFIGLTTHLKLRHKPEIRQVSTVKRNTYLAKF